MDTPVQSCSLENIGVVSLYDLLQFYTDFFLETFSMLNGMERVAVDASHEKSALMRDEAAVAVYAKVSMLKGHSEMYSFDSVASQCQRIVETLERKRMKVEPSEMARLLGDLRQRCHDEIGSRFFLYLEPKQERMYQHPDIGWEEITRRFGKMRYNVEESGKCFSLERYGAAVFHILQVAEYGVIQVAKLLQVGGDKPGWGSLKALRALVAEPYPKRSPEAQKHTPLLENVVPLAIIIKDNWRHKLDHVDNQIVWVDTDFSPEVAGEIISATRAFMRKLASDLPRTQ